MISHQGFFNSLKLRKTKGLSLYSKRISQTKGGNQNLELSWKTSCLSFLLLTQETGSETSIPLISNRAQADFSSGNETTFKRLLGNTQEQNWLFHTSNQVRANTPLADGLSHTSIQSGLTKYLKSFEVKRKILIELLGVGKVSRMKYPDVCHCLKLSRHIQLLFCNQRLHIMQNYSCI